MHAKCTAFLSLALFWLPGLVDSDAGVFSSSASSASSSDTSSSTNSGSDLPEVLSDMGSVIPGVYKEYLPQPIYYESVVPAIFQYKTPTWNKTEITFNNWYNCVSDTAPYRYSCPVTFHMNKAMVNLHVDFEGLHPISDIRQQTIQDSMKRYFERLTGHSDFCDKIQKHFAGVWTESLDFEKYLNALQACSRGAELHPVVESGIIDYNYSIRQPFTKMENNFYNTFYKHILGSGGKNSSLDLVASALLSNTRTSLQGAILGQFYAEKNRWIHANQDCRQGFIPTSVVTPEKFNESLSAILKMSVFQHQSDLSIRPGQLSKYYNLPLADCTHTVDSFVVRVLIPILKKFRGESLQLIHVHTIPFQYMDYFCRIKLPNSDKMEDSIVGDTNTGSMYIYHELSLRAYRTSCKPNELCKISEDQLDPRKSDPCVSALLSRNDTGIRTYCDFECRPKQDSVFPSVVRVASNRFVVTGNSLTLHIVCGKLIKQDKTVFIKEDHVGAMLVKLSCHCRLIIPHFNVFYGGRTCHPEEEKGADDHTRIVHSDEDPSEPDDLSVSSIIPFMFGKTKIKGVLQEEHETSANSVDHAEESVFGYYYDHLTESQIFNLTEIIDRNRIENYIRSSEMRREMAEKQKGFKGMDYYADKLQSGQALDDKEGGSDGVGCIFWTLFIISLVVVLGLQAYIIVMFKRLQRVSYAKDERILYRVDPDTASLG